MSNEASYVSDSESISDGIKRNTQIMSSQMKGLRQQTDM